MNYETMLEKGKSELPEVVSQVERFNIPKVRGHIQGNKTIVSNFTEISKTLCRPPAHVLKFILKELATPGGIKKQAVIFGSKLSANKINEKIILYTEKFVLCKECGKPDTKLTKEVNNYFLKCQACGAKQSFYLKI
ncbi:translation initiation factor IF-2 subunit beta [Candidatus Woesearchaeota archaeon]|jgi:translation initiation factor 2 subunit 2|nr:translation initiation factor IF-2 subunit beta [Candidatus Woesearchaeota archaeon]|tara:strand:- start:3680 stop:4087 length:408 start_codon:yes stop_codon:yes gene_type:complete